MHTHDLLINITPSIYNMAPYCCFSSEMYINGVNRKQIEHR